jgi:hypothetical protein
MNKILFSSCVTPGAFNPNCNNIFCIYFSAHPTGKQLSCDHELFGKKLNKGCDQGIVTEKSSTNVAPVMISPPTHNLSVHSVSEASPSQGWSIVHVWLVFCCTFSSYFNNNLDSAKLVGDNTTESSHVSNHLDETAADQDR